MMRKTTAFAAALLGSLLLAASFAPLPARAQECAPSTWLRLAGERPAAIAPAELIADMTARDVVLLGEQHDVADHHRWQLHTLAALHAKRPDMAIGFEAFPRRAQPVLDRWVAGELTPAQFLAEARWEEVWSFPPELYLPLFEFARLHRVPMLALNVERELTQSVAEKGWDAVPEREREGVSRPAAAPPPYLEELAKVHREHAKDKVFRHFVEAQQTWDRAMAEVLARHAGKKLVVGIIGSGHLRHGHGVALQLKDLGVSRIGTLLPLGGRAGCADMKVGLADAVYVLPQGPVTKPPPPRLGVQLEQRGEEVRLLSVTEGSLADRTGLKKDDIVVAAAGKPVKRMGSLVDTVRRQPDGTWLPLQIRRGADALDFVVKFPPAP